jgi:hypothetical protein
MFAELLRSRGITQPFFFPKNFSDRPDRCGQLRRQSVQGPSPGGSSRNASSWRGSGVLQSQSPIGFSGDLVALTLVKALPTAPRSGVG